MSLTFAIDGRLDGPANMARDSELLGLAASGRAGCRVYAWDGPWVSLGRFQAPERDLVDPAGSRWVVRPTGGKAVLHGHDVTVGLAVPLALLNLESRSLKAAYLAVVSPIVTAMRACGVPAILAEQAPFRASSSAARAKTADCFAFSSPNDVVDELTGIKVCGCALRLTERAVLVQASLPNGMPLVPPESVIRNAALSYRTWDASAFPSALREEVRKLVLQPAELPSGRDLRSPSACGEEAAHMRRRS